MSQITTHVLNTSLGRPGINIEIELQQPTADGWETIAAGITNNDGRIDDLINETETLEPGMYKLLFHTRKYFSQMGINTFYPFVEVIFETADNSHYHVPLLLNPFGYSTYRGS